MKPTVTQCRMRSGAREHTALIDSKFKTGQTVTIVDLPGNWTIVERYSASTMSEAEAIERSHDYTRQRDASDA